MIEIEMHWSSGYYNDESFISSPLYHRCCNCPYMPDNECGWGYNKLYECVFQVEIGKPYWINILENGTLYVNDYEITTLINYLEDIALAHMIRDDWSFDTARNDFRWEYLKELNGLREGKPLVQYYSDYWLWFHSKELCSCCGKITPEFVVYGDSE